MRVANKLNKSSCLFTLDFGYDNVSMDEPNNEYHLEGIDNSQLEKECLENQHKKLDTNPLKSLYEDSVIPESEAVDKLLFEVNYTIKKNIDPFLGLDGLWAHILHPNQSTMIHSHENQSPQNGVSWVYYVKAPDGCGNLVFDFNVHTKNFCVSFKPSVGSLILFPSWMPHYTTRNVSNETRISISGNHFPI